MVPLSIDDLRQMAMDFKSASKEPNPAPPENLGRGMTNLAALLANQNADIAEVADALRFISPDVERGNGKVFGPQGGALPNYWLGIIWAIRSALGEPGKELARQWSMQSPRYLNGEGFEAAWKQFNPNHHNAITVRSLFRLARLNGWPGYPDWRKSRQVLPHEQKLVWAPFQYDLCKPTAADWLIKGFMPTGLGVIAGQPGSGKSSCLLSLFLTAAGFEMPGSGLSIKFARHIILVTESPHQMILMLLGFCREFGWNPGDVQDAFTIIPGRRATPERIPELVPLITAKTRTAQTAVGEARIPPWVIFDTQNSSFGLEDENNNSQVGGLMSQIRTHLIHEGGASVAIVCHAAKSSSAGKDDLMARGASAFVGDAEYTATLANDAGYRSLTLNKIRFEAAIRVLGYTSKSISLELDDPYGEKETVPVRLAFPQATKFEDLTAAKQERKSQSAEELRIRNIANFHQSVQLMQGDRVAYLQTSTGRPKLPGGLDYTNSVKLTSKDLAENKVGSVAKAKPDLVKRYGWVEDGHLLLLYPAGRFNNQ